MMFTQAYQLWVKTCDKLHRRNVMNQCCCVQWSRIGRVLKPGNTLTRKNRCTLNVVYGRLLFLALL